MATNEYYHRNFPNPPGYGQPALGVMDRPLPPTPAPGYGFASSNQRSHNDLSAPYHSRHSQQSFISENGAYSAASRVPDGDQYADNIPLKDHGQYQNNMPPDLPPDWQHTQYPPPTEVAEDHGRDGRKRRWGFFRKKPAWVTYALTTVQIIIFIVELVKSSESQQARWGGAGRLTFLQLS